MDQNSSSAQGDKSSASTSDKSLFINAPIGIIKTNPEGQLLSANPAMARMFGYDSPDDLIESVNSITTQLYADPSDRKKLIRLLKENDEVLEFECRGIRRDGSTLWISLNVNVERDKNGNIIHFQSFLTDITERKKAEQESKNERAYLSDVIDNIEEAIIICNAEGRIIRFNEMARKLHGLPEKSIPSNQWAEYYNLYQEDGITPLSKEDIPLFRALQGEKVLNAEIAVVPRHRDIFHLSCSGQALTDESGRITGAVITMHDISERKRAEEALKISEKRFQNMLALIPDMVSIHEPDMNILYSNWNGFAAVPPEKRVLNTKCYKTYRGYDWICPDCLAVKALETRETIEETRMLPDGTWVDLRIIPVVNQEGNVEFFVEWVRDISNIKRAEQELRESERLLTAIIDGVSDVLAIQYPDHSIERYNQAGYDLLNMTPEEVKGRKCFELLGRDRECEKCATRKT
ncbi:MAG: PAS domain-containing protein, partial [Desulfonatronovibrionaceae bacterium]